MFASDMLHNKLHAKRQI